MFQEPPSLFEAVLQPFDRRRASVDPPAPLDALLVDDDQRFTREVAEVLADHGVCVRAHRLAGPALEDLERRPADLLIVELDLPDTTGFELLRRLRGGQVGAGLPALALSVRDDPRTRAAAFGAGADSFLSKPLGREELTAAVRSLGSRGRDLRRWRECSAVHAALARVTDLLAPRLSGHSERCARLARDFGAALSLPSEQVDLLERGGRLHDIGQIALPAGLLDKRGPLDEDERLVVEQHPVLGARLCEQLPSLGGVQPIVLHHHERWDGAGYPDGLAGAAIPFTARVVRIADVYAALTAPRPWRGALRPRAALRLLHAEASQGAFDPQLVERFVEAAALGLLPC